MKKKLSLMLCLCIMALTLAACGSADPQDVDYGGMSYSDLQSSAQNLVTSIAASSEEELSAAIETNEQYAKQYAKQYGREYTEAEAVISLLQSWLDTTSDVGTFVGLGEFSIDKTSDTVTVDQIVNFSERDVDVTFVYEYNYLTEEIEMTDATADIVYTLGEKLEKAALNTLMGMGTVFCVLILISLIAVVLAGIVGSRHHDTRRGVQIAGRKGHGRNRHQDRPDVDLDAIGRKHPGGYFCKHIALDAAVVADGHRRRFKVLFQIVCQTLRSLCHGVDVHPVGTCADDAAQTARAKGEVTVKSVLDLGIVQRFQLCHYIGIGGGICQPALVFLFNIHIVYPLTSRNCACPWMVSTSESAGTKMQSPL